jgi:hypothetical protein
LHLRKIRGRRPGGSGMKRKRIFKIKLRDKATGETWSFIMGDSYKPFEAHFLDLVNHLTKKWLYDDSEAGKGKCLGREMKAQFLEIYQANHKFVSFGGLKWANEATYDEKVAEHNSHSEDTCRYLKDIEFKKLDQAFLNKLLRECHLCDSEFQVQEAVA